MNGPKKHELMGQPFLADAPPPPLHERRENEIWDELIDLAVNEAPLWVGVPFPHAAASGGNRSNHALNAGRTIQKVAARRGINLACTTRIEDQVANLYFRHEPVGSDL